MRVISKKRLLEYWTHHPDTRTWLENWHRLAGTAKWKNLGDVRVQFPHADGVKVGSGKMATVFNVCGNKHRMVTAIHYNTGKIFILRLMSHAEYSKSQWKDLL